MRALLRRILELAEYEALEARDADDGLSILSRFPQSVVLLVADLSEPRIGGPGGIRERLPRGAKVILTSRAHPDARAGAFDDGTTFFVANPFRDDALLLKLHALRKECRA